MSSIDANDFESQGAPDEDALPYSEKKKTLVVNKQKYASEL